jgi:hypothetical protein
MLVQRAALRAAASSFVITALLLVVLHVLLR